ncbi:geopeptide radical SAM maturase [Geobacter anodireducens]|uniref:Radical SAM protein n=1 Tax=Geobacter soli TaxID=1510391 RepID=A0A0C1U472_9BACT|nr:geopeptide radical SAM maturase [Geobacter soli]KIE42565.1 radical SAM protein [Geobacter soli]
MVLSRHVIITPCPDRPGTSILFSAKRGALILVDDELLAAIGSGGLDADEEQTLAELGFLVPDHASEQQEMRSFIDESNRVSRSFSALVILNLSCNLACSYCFEGNRRGAHFMDDDTADRLVAYLISGPVAEGRSLSLRFYGGEPLLSVPTIRRIARPLKKVMDARGLSFSFSLTTNGTLLTRELVEELIPLGLVGATVTLDGPPDVHDAARPFVGGEGSFSVILANLKAVADLIALEIGGNFTPETYREYPRLFDLLVAEGLGPERLALMRFNAVMSAGENRALPEFTGGCASVNEPWLKDATLFIREELLRRGFPAPGLSPHFCAIEAEDSLIVNHDGTFYRCPAFIGIEGLAAGSLNDGPSDHAASHGLGGWKNEECLSCAYLPLCFGGCRYYGYLEHGRIDRVSCGRDLFDAIVGPFLALEVKYRHQPGEDSTDTDGDPD